MSALLQLTDVSFARGGNTLFERISLNINPGDRIGLVGHNGSGKSTLLSLITGAETPDRGEIRQPKGQRTALVEQFVPERLEPMPLSQALLDVWEPDARLGNRYRVDRLLLELGFAEAQSALPLASLSGGQQTLALLARAVLLEPELLLMDEPGNHMDLAATTYLQRYLLSDRSIPFLMISHDRELLDRCTDRTLFLRDRTLHGFDLPFDAASRALADQDLQAARSRRAEEREIGRLQTSARRLAHWGRTFDNEDLARKAKTMQRRAERLATERTTLSRGSGLDLQLRSDAVRAKSMLTIENLSVWTPDDERRLLEVEFQVIRPGDRVALLGDNGAGKSTTIARLLRSLDAEDDTVRFNPNVKVGYYDQELRACTGSCGRLDWLRERSDRADEPIKRALLQAGVAWRDMDRPVDTLSGGERARLMFTLFRLNEPNFLVLDEPTNHIDLEGREQLERQLVDSAATLLITSHDRRFIERVANRWWWIDGGRLHELDGPERVHGTREEAFSVTNVTGHAAPGCRRRASDVPVDEDAVLARIDALERLLADDRARKPKFRKPELQRSWQEEIAMLWRQVE